MTQVKAITPNVQAGDLVQTPLGKGVVREVRNHGRLLVEVSGRALVMDASAIERLDAGGRTKLRRDERATGGVPRPRPADGTPEPREIDLHGLTVAEALAAIEDAVNRALLADVAELRVIHGRSGGRIRASLHRWLRSTPGVKAFNLDARNPGVTVVSL
jgi:DNA mismatch repair protein MutS2